MRKAESTEQASGRSHLSVHSESGDSDDGIPASIRNFLTKQDIATFKKDRKNKKKGGEEKSKFQFEVCTKISNTK